MIPVGLFREVGGCDEDLRSRTTSELFFRLTERAAVQGHRWPIYFLNRGGHRKLTADTERRLTSVAYIRKKHAKLLSDPGRRTAFESNHEYMMRKTAGQMMADAG